MPGDDLSTIDWKVYARSDRYYVKKFEEETNLDCYLLLDVSASMGYGSRGVTKLEYGSMLAASLAYLMNRQRDAVGLTTFDDAIVSMLPPSARPGHLRSILVTLDRMALGHRTDVSKPLHLLADGIAQARHGGADLRPARRSRRASSTACGTSGSAAPTSSCSTSWTPTS